MARLFTIELFNQYITGTATVASAAEHRELLGRADVLVIQVVVTKSAGTSPTLTLEIEHSNDGKRTDTHSTPISAASLTITPFNTIVAAGSTTDPLAAQVELALTLGGTNPEAYVQVTVTGRTF